MTQDDLFDVDNLRKMNERDDRSQADDCAKNESGLSDEMLEQLSLAQGDQPVNEEFEAVDDFRVLDESTGDDEDELEELFSAAIGDAGEANGHEPDNDQATNFVGRRSEPIDLVGGELAVPGRSLDIDAGQEKTGGGKDASMQQAIAASEQRIIDSFEALIKEDGSKNELIKSLHEELSEYRRGIADTILLGLVRPLVRYTDQTAKQVEALRDKPPGSVDVQRLLKALASVGDDLTNILEDVGVVIFEHPNGMFDPEVQQSRSTVPTDDPSKHRLIEKRLLPGYTLNGQVIEKERVRVCVYSEKSDD